MNKAKIYILAAAVTSWVLVDTYEFIKTTYAIARNKK